MVSFPMRQDVGYGREMNKKRKGRTLLLLAIVLVIALTAVIGVIAYKEQEYKAGTDYYSSLRAGDTE